MKVTDLFNFAYSIDVPAKTVVAAVRLIGIDFSAGVVLPIPQWERVGRITIAPADNILLAVHTLFMILYIGRDDDLYG